RRNLLSQHHSVRRLLCRRRRPLLPRDLSSEIGRPEWPSQEDLMKRPLISLFIILGLITGCAYFQKKDETPPLPDIIEPKPPLTMKGEYFKAFPWDALDKPRKDGIDPDTTTYTFEKGDTLDSVAEKTMGDPRLASDLAKYNE